MKKKLLTSFYLTITVAVLFFSGCTKNESTLNPNPIAKPDVMFYGLSTSNQLLKYNAKNVETVISQVSVTGLQPSENLLAIDFRPATGQLYGLGNSSRIYIINTTTGVAIAVNTTPFTPAINGTIAGFDFNPTVDRIRIVTNLGQNLRLNPETGLTPTVDGDINPIATITGVAYTNSFAGSATTVLYDIDSQKLYKQNPPNGGVLVEVGSLGITGNGPSDFDISSDNKYLLAPITVAGMNNLYQIDTTTGKATSLGTFATPVISIAIPTKAVAYSVDNANNLLIFNLTTPGTPVSKAITGLQPSESVLGIDMRPANGQLYALGSSSRIYVINMSSGVATAVGTDPFTTLLSGTSFGFDFNPTVDRIRVVSNTGQNLRIHPTTGAIAFVDSDLNPGTPAVSAAAYTNNFAGATTTTLFAIDHSTDKLYMQNPPNAGVLVEVGSLGIDVTENNGFDIGGTSGIAYAILTVGSTTKIYTINLTSGVATVFADYPSTAKGFAVGTGF